VVVRLTGAQVRDVLEHAARYYDGLECGDAGCVVLTDGGVARYNVDSMAGLEYRVDPTRPEGDRVHGLRWDGRPLDLHQVFTVACNNYRAAGGGGFPHLDGAEVVARVPGPVDDLIAGFLVRTGAWTPRSDGNWSLAPVVLGERRGGVEGW
jgi:2',3'-cyclic-nucleotide 2'-phosphodiesterase/3'-nucleotidase